MGSGFERTALAHSRDMLILLGIAAMLLSAAAFAWKMLRAERKEAAEA